MIITLASTNDLKYAYDLASGISAGAIVPFDLEVATATALDPESGRPFQNILIDGSGWELPVKVAKTQQIMTLPNLLLAGLVVNLGKLGSGIVPYKAILEAWYYASARWIKTDELLDVTQPNSLVKVIRGEEKLEFEQVGNISWAQRCTLSVRTAGVYAA